MTTRQESRQIKNRNLLNQLSQDSHIRLDDLLVLINDEITLPFRLRQNNPVGLDLYIDSSIVSTTSSASGHGRKRVIRPIDGGIPAFTPGSITFPSSGGSGGNITATSLTLFQSYTLPILAANEWVKVGISVDSNGAIKLNFGTIGISENAASTPEIPVNAYPIGYVSINTDGSNQVVNISGSKIYQYIGGGPYSTSGGGISSIGTIDSETPSANGAVISGSSLVLQSASSSNAGLVNTGTQTFNGDKTFSDLLTAGSDSGRSLPHKFFGGVVKENVHGLPQSLLTPAKSGIWTRSQSANSVSVWTARSSAANNQWYSVCWSPELGLFCSVSASGSIGNRIMTSPDGITWTSRTAGADNDWYSVTWSPELRLFCAVGRTGIGNRVMTSPDGINWTIRTSAADSGWLSVCWSSELGLFCAVADTGAISRVMTSPDGVTWTGRTAAAANEWQSVCWSPELGLFCAVSLNGTDRVMTSPDGITWTSRTAAAANQWKSICWSPELGLFCAVSSDGSSRVMTSPDGVVWTGRTAAVANQWQSICWSPELGLFCATSISGTSDRVMTSSDGINWTARSSAADNNWQSICWSAELGMLCSVSTNGTENQIMTSSNFAKQQDYSSIVGKSTILNNQASAVNFLGLILYANLSESWTVTYKIKRILNTTVFAETGILMAVYNSETSSWTISNTAVGTSGVTFSILASGQIQYVSTNMGSGTYSGLISWNTKPIM